MSQQPTTHDQQDRTDQVVATQTRATENFTQEEMQERYLKRLSAIDDKRYELTAGEDTRLVCTLDRDLAQSDESLELLGIDHPLVDHMLREWRSVDLASIGAAAQAAIESPTVLTLWHVQTFGPGRNWARQ